MHVRREVGISDDISPRHHQTGNLHPPDSHEIIEPPEIDEAIKKDKEKTVNNVVAASAKDKSEDFFKTSKKPAEKEKPKEKRPKLLILVLVVLLLLMVAAAVYQNFDQIKKLFLTDKNISTTSETAKEISATTETASTNNQTATTTTPPATTEQPAAAATAPAVIDKSSFTIRVSNGNGVSGSGYKVASSLKSLGFNVVSTGNASTYNYKTTIVYYQAGKEAEANLVKDALATRTVSTELSATLTSYTILVIVGAK